MMGEWNGVRNFEWEEGRDIDILSFFVSRDDDWDFLDRIIFSDFRYRERYPVPHKMEIIQWARGRELCLRPEGRGHHHHDHHHSRYRRHILPVKITFKRIASGTIYEFTQSRDVVNVAAPQIRAGGARDGYIIKVDIHRNDLLKAAAGDWSGEFDLHVFSDYLDVSETFRLSIRIPPLVKIGVASDLYIHPGSVASHGAKEGYTDICIFSNNSSPRYKIWISDSSHYHWRNRFRLCLDGDCRAGHIPYSIGFYVTSNKNGFCFDYLNQKKTFRHHCDQWFDRCDSTCACARIWAMVFNRDLHRATSGNYSDTVSITLSPD
ncbi:hypothetical protein [Spongorhabdus nitratireducens]